MSNRQKKKKFKNYNRKRQYCVFIKESMGWDFLVVDMII